MGSGVWEFGDLRLGEEAPPGDVPPPPLGHGVLSSLRIPEGEEEGGESLLQTDGTLGSSLLFSTPVSRSASQVDESAGEEDGSKVGLLLVVSPDVYCGGVIKSDGPTKWCTRARRDCTVKAHGQKVILKPTTYYIKCPKRTSQARLEPSLSAICGSIPNEDSRMEGKLATMDTWVSYIHSVIGHEVAATWAKARREAQAVTGFEVGGDEDSWEQVATPPRLNEFRREATLMKTPRRIELRQPPIGDTSPLPMDRDQAMQALADLTPTTNDVVLPTGDDLGKWLETMARDWSKVKDNFRVMSCILEDEKAASRFNFDKLSREMASLGCKVSLLDTRIGTNPLEGNGVVSVWEGIEGILSDGKLLRDAVVGLEEQYSDLEKLQTQLESALGEEKKERAQDKAILKISRLVSQIWLKTTAPIWEI
jgi:hypothetical protein